MWGARIALLRTGLNIAHESNHKRKKIVHYFILVWTSTRSQRKLFPLRNVQSPLLNREADVLRVMGATVRAELIDPPLLHLHQ